MKLGMMLTAILFSTIFGENLPAKDIVCKKIVQKDLILYIDGRHKLDHYIRLLNEPDGLRLIINAGGEEIVYLNPFLESQNYNGCLISAFNGDKILSITLMESGLYDVNVKINRKRNLRFFINETQRSFKMETLFFSPF